LRIDDMDDEEIVAAINDNSIEAEDLVSRDGWRLICQVRGRNFNEVDEEAWEDLCKRRGYIQSRQNPRGF
jgi:hypothetical protein